MLARVLGVHRSISISLISISAPAGWPSLSGDEGPPLARLRLERRDGRFLLCSSCPDRGICSSGGLRIDPAVALLRGLRLFLDLDIEPLGGMLSGEHRSTTMPVLWPEAAFGDFAWVPPSPGMRMREPSNSLLLLLAAVF